MIEFLLVLGYIAAVPPLFVIIHALKKPSANMFNSSLPRRAVLASEVFGALLITIGWLARGNVSAWIINGLWLIIFSVLWFRAERKSKTF